MEGFLETQKITQGFNPNEGTEGQLKPGFVLMERYLIQEVIGLGGMGSVYKARDLHFPNVIRLVAVKEMINQAPDPVIRQTIIQNFEREANILATLSHRGIPQILDFFTFSERSYLVIEFVNGKDLEALLNITEDFFSEDQVIAWAIELCDVLNYLHTHKPEPIIFRDIKPSNIMVNQNNHIVLVDFGIAKIFKMGQKGTMIGTEGYSPPEQYRGEASTTADIYSLGATMHHLLTRRDPRLEPPFSFQERPIRQINPSVSIELETVINTALQYNPGDRFKTIQMLKDALLSVAKKTGALSRVAIRTGPLANEPSIKPLWTFECEDEIRSSPVCDGQGVYVGAYDHNVYAVNTATGNLLWKYATEGGIASRPTISSGLLYIGSEDGRLYAIGASSGKVSWTYETAGPIRSSPTVFERHVLIGSDDGFLHAVNTTTSRSSWKIDSGRAIRSTPIIQGDMVYFGNEAGELLCSDLDGQIRWRFKAKRAITSSPLIHQGSLFITSLDGTFYSLDAKSGWVIWRFRMGKGSVSTPCNMENMLFAGSADGFIYCIDSANAREIWRFKTDHQVSGSPIIYKDALYCGSADGKLYCLDYKTGRVRWKFVTGGPITGAPYAINDVVYVGSTDHILYALLP